MDDPGLGEQRRRGLAGRQRPIRRPCLLVVDLSYGFTDPRSPLGCDAQLALHSTARLLASARQLGVPRIFTRIAYDDAGRAAAAAFLEKMPALGILEPGSRWSQIDAAVAPEPGEPVVTKRFASGFFGTGLAGLLSARACDGVIVAGASTSGCVRATVVDALQHGHRVLVVRDAVADRARSPHEAALFDIEAKYGHVVALDEALAAMRDAGRPAIGVDA